MVKQNAKSSVPSNTVTGGGSASNPQPQVSQPVPAFVTQVQQMLTGFQTVVPAGFVLPSAGGGYSQAEVVAQLSPLLPDWTAYENAKAQAKDSVSQAKAAYEASLPALQTLMKTLKAALIGYFGSGNPALAKFGIVQKTRAKPNPVKLTVAAAKARQTRVKNGTLGKQQKKALALAQELQSVSSTLLPGSASSSTPVAAPSATPESK